MIVRDKYGNVACKRDMDCVKFAQEMKKAMELKPGKTYTLYAKTTGKGSLNKAVARKRKLIGHYHGCFARFEKPQGTIESYLYAELADMIKKPKGMKIIKEGEWELDE